VRAVIRYIAVGLASAVAIAIVWRAFPDQSATREIPLRVGGETRSIGRDIGVPELTLRLTSLTLPTRQASEGELIIDTGDAESAVKIEEGAHVTLNETAYEVSVIRAWAGLLHRPPGAPMINCAVQPPGGEWIENVFIPIGGWQIIPPELAVFATQAGAPFNANSARWGVVEGERIHWFTSFVPGTGVELRDGVVVTLLARRPSGRILVEFDSGGERERVWFDANQSDETSPIRYDDPGTAAFRLRIEVHENRTARITLRENDLQHWSREVEVGAVVPADTSGLRARVDQIEMDAFPLLAAESPFLEAVLVNDDRVLRIRESEAVRMGESTVTFEAVAEPREATAAIEIDGALQPLGENDVYESGPWTLSEFRANNPAEAVLRATYSQSRLRVRALLAAACVAAACGVLFLTRRRT
jgi:hypothetical protein